MVTLNSYHTSQCARFGEDKVVLRRGILRYEGQEIHIQFAPVTRDRRTKSPWLLSEDRATCYADFSGRPFLLNLLLGPVGKKRGRQKELTLNNLRDMNFPESIVLMNHLHQRTQCLLTSFSALFSVFK